jgi:hypothetical protein
VKALTLTQPWATLVAIRAKHIETRSWATSYRGPLAIHAAKVPDHYMMERVRREGIVEANQPIPTGMVVATARLVDVVPTQGRASNRLRYVGLPIQGGWEATPFGFYSASTDEWPFGDFSPDRWAWLLADVEPLPAPVAAKGARGLWDWQEAA